MQAEPFHQPLRFFLDGRGDDHPVVYRIQQFLARLNESPDLNLVVMEDVERDMEIRKRFHSLEHAVLYIRPIISILMRRKETGKTVSLIRSQRTGIHVGTVIQLTEYLLHFFPAGL